MLLQCSEITKTFEGRAVLNACSFHIEENEKCAIVGMNGAGKSTMLKIITGNMIPDSGSVTFKSGISYGYLSQQDSVDTSNTVWDELMLVKKDLTDEETLIRSLELQMKTASGDELTSIMKRYSDLMHDFEMKNGYAIKSEVTGILKGLGFSEDEFSKKIQHLSGGQKTRVALGKLLLSRPELIMLDEPTNHLDLASIEWLENFLVNYRGAVIIVAHDRYFLDRIVTKVVEIENASARTYSGNYTAFAEKKKMLRDSALKAYMNQQAEIKHSEEVIAKLKSFNREKSIKRAESREKMLDKIERIDAPSEINDAMHLTITPSLISGNDVLSVKGLSKAFPGNILFNDISFEIKRGERVALIGNNGTGKTTILKIIQGIVPEDTGSVFLGTNVKTGYYDQEHQVLHKEKTLFEEISDEYPDMDNTRIRNTLAAFLFYGDDVFKLVGALSGGERGRLSLAKLMLSNANFLILDEPTNHLDITSKEILENALNDYTGTVFYVSHDRYFINTTATRILDLTNHTIINYIGNYDYYAAKKDDLSNRLLGTASDTGRLIRQSGDPSGNGLNDWQTQKAEAAEKRRKDNAIKKCEEKISSLETRSSGIDALLADDVTARNVSKCAELSAEQASIRDELSALYDEWERLQS